VKNIKFVRVLAAFTIAFLLVAILALPVLGNEIELHPEEGGVGDEVNISEGEKFTANTTVRIFFSSQDAHKGDYIDYEVTIYELVKITSSDRWGEIDVDVDIPDELTDGDDDEVVRSGTYYFYFTYDSDRIRDVAEFTVIAGEIEIGPEEGYVGTEVVVTGYGFADREDIEIEYDGDDITDDIIDGEAETDSDGEFEFTFIVHESTTGDHTITVTDESGSEAEGTFTVEPQITVNPTSGGAGNAVSINGTGFGDELTVTVTLGGEWVVSDDTDDTGSFATSFIVPGLTPGTYDIEAEDDDYNSAEEVEFNLSLSATITPVTSTASPGNVGTEVTVDGVGFTVGGLVTVKYDDIQVGAATADANGAFAVTFTVPPSKSGEHDITVSDGINTEEFSFNMESEPPLVPAPLKPEMGIKAEALTVFDWANSTDPSGVTYSLQVATDTNFVSGSIVLNKTGLPKSEYTITEAEKLESGGTKAPYYWRVKAVDGASNESEWSGVGSFTVGLAFGMPTWAIYFIIGVIVVALATILWFIFRKRGAVEKVEKPTP